MKGIILMSHGPLAKGMYETTKLFMGEDIPQYGYLCLEASDAPEDFDVALKEKIKEVDSGEGVILLADLMGGTPCNRAVIALADGNAEMLAGMNLAAVLELLGNRLSGNYDMAGLEQTGKDGVVYVNPIFDQQMSSDDDE